MAKEISMLQRSEKGKEIRRYFIGKEKEYIQLLKETQAHYYMEPFLELVNLAMEVA